METSKTICTNIKTMKKTIIGKYDHLKADGMVWSRNSSPIFINFDFLNCEEEITQKLISKWKKDSANYTFINTDVTSLNAQLSDFDDYANSEKNNNFDTFIDQDNNKTIIIYDKKTKSFDENTSDYCYQKKALIEQLFGEAEEISHKINILVRDNEKNKLTQIDDLRNQRRYLWQKIEEIESKENLNIPIKKSQNVASNNLQIINEKLPEKLDNIDKENIDYSKQVSYCLCACSDNENSNDQKNIKINNYNQTQQIITDMIKNITCNDITSVEFNTITNNINSSENLIISKLIDQNKNNYVLHEKELNFISMDLCYLIPGMAYDGITIIIFFEESSSINSNLLSSQSIEKRTKYLKEKCNIKVGKINNFTDPLESSSILTSVIKNEIKFLYITNDTIENDQKLIGVLNVANTQNSLARIVFIIKSVIKGKSNEDNSKMEVFQNISNTMKSFVDKIKDVPILIITNTLNDLDIGFLSIPPENIIIENDEFIIDQTQDKNNLVTNKIPNNLFLEVMHKKSPLLTKNMDDIFNWLISNHYISNIDNEDSCPQTASSGVFFSLTNRDAESISTWLNKKGVPAAFFHSKMNEVQQREVIFNWETGGIKIVVIADTKNNQSKKRNNENDCPDDDKKVALYQPFAAKNDIRFVIHYSLPLNFSEYIDQANIAGKDGFIAHSLIMFNEIDVKIVQRMISISPVENKSFDLQENIGTPEDKSIQNGFGAIVEYCLNDEHCRRVDIMRYYDFDFCYKDCYCMCDKCEERSKSEDLKIDTTVHAINMLNIINVLNSEDHKRNIFPTCKIIIEIYVGKKCIKKKTINSKQEIEIIEEISPIAPEFKGKKEILLIKTLKEMINREILKIITKRLVHGCIHYFEAEKSIETIDEPIFA